MAQSIGNNKDIVVGTNKGKIGSENVISISGESSAHWLFDDISLKSVFRVSVKQISDFLVVLYLKKEEQERSQILAAHVTREVEATLDALLQGKLAKRAVCSMSHYC